MPGWKFEIQKPDGSFVEITEHLEGETFPKVEHDWTLPVYEPNNYLKAIGEEKEITIAGFMRPLFTKGMVVRFSFEEMEVDYKIIKVHDDGTLDLEPV